jgi:hypothetical protein
LQGITTRRGIHQGSKSSKTACPLRAEAHTETGDTPQAYDWLGRGSSKMKKKSFSNFSQNFPRLGDLDRLSRESTDKGETFCFAASALRRLPKTSSTAGHRTAFNVGSRCRDHSWSQHLDIIIDDHLRLSFAPNLPDQEHGSDILFLYMARLFFFARLGISVRCSLITASASVTRAPRKPAYSLSQIGLHQTLHNAHQRKDRALYP